jgi:hypothetical protein
VTNGQDGNIEELRGSKTMQPTSIITQFHQGRMTKLTPCYTSPSAWLSFSALWDAHLIIPPSAAETSHGNNPDESRKGKGGEWIEMHVRGDHEDE